MIGKAKYGLLINGVFGFNIISGLVTGVRYTENKPLYELSFGKNVWWTEDLFNTKEELIDKLNLPTLERIKETHNLKIKFENNV